jgi:uncharacterized protein YkwD
LIRVERQRHRRVWGAGAIAVALVAVLASFALAADQGGGSQGGAKPSKCDHADDAIREVSGPQLRKAVLCLLNQERSRHARSRLALSKKLGKAAQAHTDTMVATNCLSHTCQGEPDLEGRIKKSGYLKGAHRWQFAENTGCGLSAEAMVANWMASTFHRINILGKKFRDVGIGLSDKRVPSRCSEGYGTFTTVFAYRTP